MNPVLVAIRLLTQPANKVLPKKKHRAAAMFLAITIVMTPGTRP